MWQAAPLPLHLQRYARITPSNAIPWVCILSYVLIVIVKIDVPWAQPVRPDKLLVSRRPLRLGIARQHALDAHADALHILDGTPALVAQKIQADEAVRVDMRVQRNRPVGGPNEGDFRCFCSSYISQCQKEAGSRRTTHLLDSPS